MAEHLDSIARINSLDGFWTAEFGSSAGMFGGGVAVFREGKVWGGDGLYYYVGEYDVKGNAFRATLKVTPFIEGSVSVFGTTGRDLTLELEGSFTEEGQAIAQGRPKEMPDLKFGVKLTKRC